MCTLLVVYVSSLNNIKGIHKTSEITMDYAGNEPAFEPNSNNLIVVDNSPQSMNSYQSVYTTGAYGKGIYWKTSTQSQFIGSVEYIYRGLCFGSTSYPPIKCIYFKDYPY